MASFLLFTKHLFRSNLIHGLKVTKVVLNHKLIGIRFLFTEGFLGIPDYLLKRDRINSLFGPMKGEFIARMEELTNSESKMIFAEDLKNIIFLTEGKDKDMSLLSNAIKKYHRQNQPSTQFGTYFYGPIVMRLFHHLSDWDSALKLFKDPELRGFFSQNKSVVILMNLLFINGRYQECLEVLDFLQKENLLDTNYPNDCLLLSMASAYKLNTAEAFDYALDLVKKSRDSWAVISRKALCLFAALSLNQNQPNTALEVLSLLNYNYNYIRNLRFMALTDLERFDDLFTGLRLILSRKASPETRLPEVLEETLNRIKEKLESKDDKRLHTEFSQIERGLKEGNHIQRNNSIEQILLNPVVGNQKRW